MNGSSSGGKPNQQSHGMHTDPLLDPSTIRLLERLSVSAKGRIRGTMQGKRRSRSLGSSLEFADFRPYVPGDDIRRIDWNVYGRSGRAFVRQYWDEQELQVHLMVDVSRSMSFDSQASLVGEPDHPARASAAAAAHHAANKLYYALQLAASVGYTALAGEDRVSAKLFANSVTGELPPLRGRGSARRLFHFLTDAWQTNRQAQEGTAAAGSDDMYNAFMSPSSLPRLAGQTWLFTDGLYAEGMERVLSALIGARQEVVFVHLLSPAELRPDLNGELRLIDSELKTGKDVALGTSVIESYLRALKQHQSDIRTLCGKCGAGYLFVDTGIPLEQTLHSIFRAAGFLRG
ncbi:DUF58 domain-containing protein [Paenibacillus mendelii]|uniref:DUF58 domain-containing protein n=1 Tax=Paenibacillus mendelii TaxID=206163 RepID=A0ABV6JGV8_9BACL|nr:DUF58 domain-containing protein [Paenibacillus mendelii]MCQ6557824.1 DUF58 domain-containing protein [Paenibacillus mendelii]